MADDGKLTPEKQLLNLIENPKQGSAPGAAQPPSRAWGLTLGSIRGILSGRLSFFKRTTGKKLALSKHRMDIRWVNRFLTAVVGCLLVYVVGDAVASVISMQRPLHFESQKEKQGAAETESVSPLRDSAYYLQKVTARDIFKEAGKRVKQESKKEATPQANNAVVGSLSLVGISWSSNPDVIIEDKSTQRTFFVKRGQVVGDNVKVEAIFKDHVVLSYEGQEFELR